MYARVAKFEGGDASQIRANAERIQAQSATGPPEGVPSTGFTFLIDPDGGQVIAIGLFETDEDYSAGDAVLNAMSPPEGTMGERVSVTKYEVAIDIRM